MNLKYLPYQSLFLIPFLLLVSGCLDMQPSNDKLIAEMIEGGLSVRDETLNSSDSMFADYKVYRDGDKEGVVFEYIYAADVIVDRSELTPDKVKQSIVSGLASDPDAKQALSTGIYARFVYKSFDGTVLCDLTITGADF